MLEIGMKVCWIGEGSLSASFLSFLISGADTFPLFSSLFVALSTPLTNRVSLTLILLALDISLMSTLEQAETPSSPTDVAWGLQPRHRLSPGNLSRYTIQSSLRRPFAGTLIRAYDMGAIFI